MAERALAFVQDIAYRMPLVWAVTWMAALLVPLRRDRGRQVSVQVLPARTHCPEADFSGNCRPAEGYIGYTWLSPPRQEG